MQLCGFLFDLCLVFAVIVYCLGLYVWFASSWCVVCVCVVCLR